MIKRIMSKLDFPAEAIEYLAEQYARLTASDETKDALSLAHDALFVKEGDYMSPINEIAEKTGIHDHTVSMLVLLDAADTLRNVYKENGLSDKVWYDSMYDLRTKLLEYKNLTGLWGTNVESWFKQFFTLDRFALGRLQYNKGTLNTDCGEMLKAGDTVIYIHIPSSGPLNIDDVRESLRMARDWYKKDFEGGDVPLACSSWLLYTPLTERLPDRSNIKKFAALFDIFDNRGESTNKNFWRIFYRKYSPELLSEIEPKNSLERAAVELIKSGDSLGVGLGIIRNSELD